MRTTTLYKVVYLNSNNILDDIDFETEGEARLFANQFQTYQIFRYKLITEVENIT